MTGRPTVSAFVVTYNRCGILPAVLKRLSFVDELFVLDKCSGDDTQMIARDFTDKVLLVPWSPTVEETRVQGAELCSGDWLIYLDDDEILSPTFPEFVRNVLATPVTDIYEIPIHHYILGRHFTPMEEWRPTLSRRGALQFGSTVHAGIRRSPGSSVLQMPQAGDVFITHLSHANVAQYLEKTNRYTDQQGRVGERAPNWTYEEAVGRLQAIYQEVDCLKRWEEGQIDGDTEFQRIVDNVLHGLP